jgi:hypothetical protein
LVRSAEIASLLFVVWVQIGTDLQHRPLGDRDGQAATSTSRGYPRVAVDPERRPGGFDELPKLGTTTAARPGMEQQANNLEKDKASEERKSTFK